MSWKDPQPPVLDYWIGMLILTLAMLATGGLFYLFLA